MFDFSPVAEWMYQWGDPPPKGVVLPEHKFAPQLEFDEGKGPEGLIGTDGNQVPFVSVIRQVHVDVKRKGVPLPVEVVVRGFGRVRVGVDGWELVR